MDSPQTSEDAVSFNLDSFIKGYRMDQEVWSPELLEDAVPEPSNVVNKYVVSVQRDGKVVGHLMKGKSSHFVKTISFLCVPIRRTTALVLIVKAVKHRYRKLFKCLAHCTSRDTKNLLTF